MNWILRRLIFYIIFAAIAVGVLAAAQALLGTLSFFAIAAGAVLAFIIWTLIERSVKAIVDNIIPPEIKLPTTFEPESPLGFQADDKPAGRNGRSEVERLKARVGELKELGQFSEALNFTVNFDAMLLLVYHNCQDVLNSRDFQIHLYDPQIEEIYTAFFMEDNERIREKEGPQAVVKDKRVLQVIEIGLVYEHQAGDGRYWLTAPLNAGAETVGALQASHAELDVPFTEAQKDRFGLFANRTATAVDHWQTNQQLQIRVQQLQTLNDVIHSINAEQEVEPLLNVILEKAIELLNVEAGSFLLVDEDTGDLEFWASHGPSSDELIGTRLPAGTGIAGQVARTGTSIILNDVKDESQWFSGVDSNIEFSTRSMLTVPLISQKQVLGVIQMVNRRNGAPFTKSDEVLMAAFAGEAAVALENARLFQQTDEKLQERVRELTLLQNLDRDLNQTLELASVLKLALNWIVRLFDATAGGLVLFDEDGMLLAAERHGYDSTFDQTRFDKLEDYPGLVGEVARTGDPILTRNVKENPHYVEAKTGTQSQMTIPIVHEQRTIGAAAIESEIPNAYDEEDLESAVRLVNHVTVSISNALLYDEVKAANNAKSEFVSIVSHELKTPLTAIRGYTDLMLSGLTGEINKQQGEYMHTIISNVNRMMNQIQDLTDISRMDTGQLSVHLQPIPFANVVSETITSIQALAAEKNIDIHLDMHTDLPLVMGDHGRLVQVLTNLLSNACKYSPPDTDVCVSVSRRVNGSLPVVYCAVTDEGYGISPEDQQKLFTKFFRSENPDVRASSGTGLGLSITKGLIELHGGELGFDSELGKGTTFYFTLPEAPQ